MSLIVTVTLMLAAGWNAAAFRFGSRFFNQKSSLTMMSDAIATDFNTVVVSGFVSKEQNFAEPFIFNKLYESGRWNSITTVTDDEKFAKKRLVTPKTVYSGLVDVLNYAVVSPSKEGLENALAGKDAWLSFNISSADVLTFADLAVKAGLKRVVFGVRVTAEEVGADVTFEAARSSLSAANIAYTIIKFSDVKKMGEAKFPYRIVRGALPLPNDGDLLASEDLMRVLVEIMDIPKTFDNVYGIGPGSKLDTEILVYMKAQGWPERVQVGLLVGDMMERIEERYAQEKANKEKASKLLAERPQKALDTPALPTSYEGNKMAGFFS